MALPILRRGGSPVPMRRQDANPQNRSQDTAFARQSPWNELTTLDHLLDSVFPSPLSWGHGTAPAMPGADGQLELYETDADLMAYLYAPGLDPNGFDISAGAASVTIKAERKPLQGMVDGLASHTPWANLATSSGTVSASYDLPVEIDPGKVEANYKDGVLRVRMPKSEAAKPRQIKVQVGSGAPSEPNAQAGTKNGC